MKRKKWILAAALTLTAALLALLLYQLDLGAWQSLDLSRIRNQPLATVVFDREDAAAGALSGAVNRVWVSLEDLPSYVPQAFVAAEDSGIKSLADVKGKIINLGDPGSGNRINALQVFKEVGLEPGKDFRGEGLKPADAPHTLQDGRIDGFFYASVTAGYLSAALESM